MKPVLLIHGGAGVIRSQVTEGLLNAREQALTSILEDTFAGLAGGGSALDAVENAVIALENEPQFNAGIGSVLTAQGRVEMDASIMSGFNQEFGAVCCARATKNPIRLAREIMQSTPHTLMAGDAADHLAAAIGLPQLDNNEFVTSLRRAQWQRLSQRQGRGPVLDHQSEDQGTVGAVALDSQGRLAAATSTGGMMMQLDGRVGDTPICGAGTYADSLCAVSATGHGEIITRYVWAARLAERLAVLRSLGKEPRLADEAKAMVAKAPVASGGLIAVSNSGEPVAVFNTEGMYYGVKTASQTVVRTFVEYGT